MKITTILRALNVPFASGRQMPFTVANESRLEYIFYDFQKAARKALAEAHPDVGGDTEAFQNLLSHIEMVRRSFGRLGIGSKRNANTVRRSKVDLQHCARERNQRWQQALAIYSRLVYLMRKDGALPPSRNRSESRKRLESEY